MSKELATIKASEYTVLATDQSQVAEVLADVLGGEGFGPNDFDVVTVPTGASAAMWNLPSADPVKVISGIIIHQNLSRAMWLTPIDKQGDSGPVPPDCLGKINTQDGQLYGSRSQIEIYGMWNEAEFVSRPTGVKAHAPHEILANNPQPCDNCPFAEFGTSANGKGQFCGLKRILYVLTPDQTFPLVVRVPSKSLKAAKKYLIDLGKKGKRPQQVVTNLGLTKVPGNPSYYVIDFQAGEILDSETSAKAQAYAQAMKPFIERAAEKKIASMPDDSEY